MPFWFVPYRRAARSARKRLRQPGATNVLRIGGKGAAVAVLIFDILKAHVARLGRACVRRYPFLAGAYYRYRRLSGAYLAGLFGFKGGKGVATAFGAIAPIGWDLPASWLALAADGPVKRLFIVRGDISALIAPFYVWWFKPAVHLPGIDAVMSHFAAPS
ncbi:glycerol-3-phosphate acyltransferase [Salmonella enterica subsp. enterica]|nr:glycerol-3-phosphate acyltransferase [Salmonella enterica subsp. enterica]